jgi:hypothetical protein
MDGRILGCGGNEFKGKKLMIRKTTWEIGKGHMRKLVDMCAGRCFHGISMIENKPFVYVFGGGNEDEQGAEVYSLDTSQWSKLPKMQFPHSSFQPCAHASLILLCGGNRGGHCEVFDSVSLTYRILSIVTQLGFSLTVSAGNGFITYSRMLEQRWSLTNQLVTNRSTEKWDLSTRSPPLHYEGRTYIASAVENCVFVVTEGKRVRLLEK